jgi:hypothetical protein
MQHLHHLNPWAILTGGLVFWILGATWYSPVLFAKPWMAMLGIQKTEGRKPGMLLAMTASLICDIVMVFMLEHLIMWSDANTFEWGAIIGVIAWLGFIAAPSLPQGMYEGRPFKLFAINSGYWLVGLILVGGMLAVWH